MKVFVAGPRALSILDKNVTERLNNIIERNITVLVGDANGIDKSVQQYFFKQQYRDVYVFASEGKARNNIGKWPVQSVEVMDNMKGFNFYAAKDLEMAEKADYGLMIWNGKSKGTLNNIINLAKQNKKVLIYFMPHKKFYSVNNLDMVEKLASLCSNETSDLFRNLSNPNDKSTLDNDTKQMTLFT